MWQNNEDTREVKRNWGGVRHYCKNLDLLGFRDWRLPTKEELVSIASRSERSVSLDQGETKSYNTYINNYVRCVRVVR